MEETGGEEKMKAGKSMAPALIAAHPDGSYVVVAVGAALRIFNLLYSASLPSSSTLFFSPLLFWSQEFLVYKQNCNCASEILAWEWNAAAHWRQCIPWQQHKQFYCR